MELQIRYCTTSDGVSIAWGEMGQGPGEILVPDTVRGLLSGKQCLFSDRGEFVAEGI